MSFLGFRLLLLKAYGFGGVSNNVFSLVPSLAKISVEPSCRGTNLTCSRAFFGEGTGDEFARSTSPCTA